MSIRHYKYMACFLVKCREMYMSLTNRNKSRQRDRPIRIRINLILL